MMDKKTHLDQAAILRQQAEELAAEQAIQLPENLEALLPEQMQQMLHEVRVHQIELEMQNDQLRRTQGELDATRERYFDLYDLAPVGYCTISEEGLILEANLTLTTLLGVPRSALDKQPVSRFIFSEDQDTYYLHRKRLFETGMQQVCELRLKHAADAPFWARIESTIVQDVGGALVGRTVISDISERKQAESDRQEAERHKSETKYRLLFENMEEGFSLHEIIQDENGKVVDFRFLDANKAYERHTGMKRDGLIGKTMLEVMPQADRQQIEAYGRVALTGEPLEYEYYSKTFDRSMRVKAFCPQPRRFATIFEDITERKQAERDLKESEEKFHILFNNTIYAVCIFDQQTTELLDVNDAFTRLYGYSRDELLAGMTVYDLNAEPQKSKEAVQQAIRTGNLFIPLRTHRKKDGTVFSVEIANEPYIWQGKQVMASIIHDITERKRAEAALRESELRYHSLFENSPISLWEEDFSGIRQRLEGLRAQGVSDLRTYLTDHPEEVVYCRSLIKVLDVNRATLALYHAGSKEVLLKGLPLIFVGPTVETPHEEIIAIGEGRQAFQIETFNYTLDGEPRHGLLSWTVAPGYETTYGKVIVSILDITRRKLAEEKLCELSLVDELTHLNNRRGFSLLANQQIKTTDRLKQKAALIFADIDDMKLINDTLGHQEGDRALVDTANILRSALRASDIIARWGGDEFVAFALETQESTGAIIVARLVEQLNAFNLQKNRPYPLSISFGVTIYDPQQPCSLEALLERGDKAMYEQKQAKKPVVRDGRPQ